jgi:hypothetical protein
MATFPALVLCALAALASAGCGSQTSTDDGFEPPPEQAVPYDASAAADYPAGPYGIEKGSVIDDYEFPGFANPMRLPKELVTIRLSDFYNPTGDGLYPAGGPFPEGQPKPRALLIVMSAVWCGPCQLEAAKTLPDKHEAFAPGGEFLLVLADSESAGVAADESDLSGWTNKFDTDYPAVIDPDYDLGQQFPQSSYPANMILDTKTMTILEKITGAAPEEGSFWDTFASLVSQQ